MSIQTTPNGIVTRAAGKSVQYTNLGAVAAAAVTIVQSTLSYYYKLGIVAGTTTRLFPPMPVGSELTFEVCLGLATSFLQIQEEDDTGVARALSSRRPAGGSAAFTTITPMVVVANQITGLLVVTDTFSLSNAATGRLEGNGAGIGHILITYKKIAENTTGTADGWVVTRFQQQGYSAT